MKRRRPAEPADTVSLKHKGDATAWGGAVSCECVYVRRGGGQAQRGSLFAALFARSLPSSLSSYLAILPLTNSQRPFAFFISFVPPPTLPPPQSLSLSLSHQASTQKCLPLPFPPLDLPCSDHSPPLPLAPQTLSGTPPKKKRSKAPVFCPSLHEATRPCNYHVR